MFHIVHVVRILAAALLVGAVGLFTLPARADLPSSAQLSPVFKQPIQALHSRLPLGFAPGQDDFRGSEPASWPAGILDAGNLAYPPPYPGLDHDLANRFLFSNGALKPRVLLTRAPASAAPTARPPTVRLSQIPLHFEPNQGQTDPAVQFLARGPGYGLFLTPTEAVLSLHRGKPTEPVAETPSPLAGEGGGGGAEPARLARRVAPQPDR